MRRRTLENIGKLGASGEVGGALGLRVGIKKKENASRREEKAPSAPFGFAQSKLRPALTKNKDR